MIPKHIGFIMDGNGRWAQSHGLPREKGYIEGLRALKTVANECARLGISAISVYALSTENLARPQSELDAIFKVVENFNLSYDGNFVVRYMGDCSLLPENVKRSVDFVEEKTKHNGGMILNIALGYGAQADIVNAAKLTGENCSAEEFEKHLSTAGLPPLDLVVRTGGEKRLSNFLLYELAYAELIFLDDKWPDMDENKVDECIAEFEGRKRKFGK